MALYTNCSDTHNMTELSCFTFSMSVMLALLTIPTNLAVILSLLRKKQILCQSAFHKILLNVAFADLLTGLVSDSVSISFHLKELLRIPISLEEKIALHTTLFVINGASILNMVLLCIDRVAALKKPLLYRNGLVNWKCLLALASTWVLSSCLIGLYFKYGYIRYLAVFSTTTVAFACVSLFVTIGIFHIHIFNKSSKIDFNLSKDIKNNNIEKCEQVSRVENLDNKEISINGLQSDSSSSKENVKTTSRRKKKSEIERSVNKSFIIMLIVFLVSYLPACVMIIYMNACEDCDCILVHILRDLTYLAILSSALLRPLNFIYRLKIVNITIKKLFKKQ